MRKLSILGATGTIGQNTLSLVAQHPEMFEVQVLTGGKNVALLAQQAKAHHAHTVVIEDVESYASLKEHMRGTSIHVEAGAEAIAHYAGYHNGIVLSGITGIAGLAPTMAAIKAGACIGIANKESLVCAGALMRKAVQTYGATLIPVDSEHNAIYQCIKHAPLDSIEHITLTASGGPFRTSSFEAMQQATRAQALKHPNWTMGAKITIDSATMMNKGLEIIEAWHLFPVAREKIQAVIHPESIVHCLVGFCDGAMLAGLSIPDMRIPIALALGMGERFACDTPRLHPTQLGTLRFETPDEARFPALRVAREVLFAGGDRAIVMNAANEVAVEAFLADIIAFPRIIAVVEEVLARMPDMPVYSVEDVWQIDAIARQSAKACVSEVAIA